MTNELARALRDCLDFLDNVPTDEQLRAKTVKGTTGLAAGANARAVLARPQPSAGATYLAQCEAMRDAATDDKTREYWHRHAGAVRKSLAMI